MAVNIKYENSCFSGHARNARVILYRTLLPLRKYTQMAFLI
jgi:hypothetical protein